MHSKNMIFSLLLAFILAFANADEGDKDSPTTGELGNATIVENNPPDVVYTATLPKDAFFKSDQQDKRGNVKGSVSAVAAQDGIGVEFQVQFSNLPESGGPFLYHIHAAPVPEDGNCTETLGHLDPFIRGETPECDAAIPQTCQVGDLSGKYGQIDSDPFQASFEDLFASTKEGIGAFFGNRSITIHFANATRITCANFNSVNSTGNSKITATFSSTTAVSSSGSSSNGNTNSTSSGATQTTASPVSQTSTGAVQFTGSASKLLTAPHAVLMLGAAMAFAL